MINMKNETKDVLDVARYGQKKLLCFHNHHFVLYNLVK